MTDKTGNGPLVFANAPTLTNPVVGTQSPGDNSAKAASTAYVDAGLSGLTSFLTKANNLSDVASVSTARSNLGLGTAAVLDVGTGANNIVQRDASGHYPNGDGSAITNLPSQSGRLVAGTPLILQPVALSSSTTQAHGLGTTPDHIKWVWECLTANLSYSAGDKIIGMPLSGIPNVLFDSTNLICLVNSSAIGMTNKTTFAGTPITPGDWKLTLTPYKLT